MISLLLNITAAIIFFLCVVVFYKLIRYLIRSFRREKCPMCGDQMIDVWEYHKTECRVCGHMERW